MIEYMLLFEAYHCFTNFVTQKKRENNMQTVNYKSFMLNISK